MIVPRYWAEGRAQNHASGKQITARRFGWSNASQADAQTMADQRARETLALLLAGKPLPRRDPKRAYNGADGVPIREEIVREHGSTVITRNAYGALCLNTPDVLFVDIDFRHSPTLRQGMAGCAWSLLTALAVAWPLHRAGLPPFAIFFVCFMTLWVGTKVAAARYRAAQKRQGGPVGIALAGVRVFAAAHPAWGLRLYRTPHGLRVLATHRTFLPDDPEVFACFDALHADPVYVRMCLLQRCFRARVSPKPWRAGVREHIKPRRAVWPVAPENLPARADWITRYEAASRPFASCRLLETFGDPAVHPDVRPVQELHDSLCQALENGLPFA